MWLFFALCMLGICVAIVLLIRRYAFSTVEPIMWVATAYAWLTAMMIIALVPIDVSATMAKENTTAISVLWNIAYWSTQVATWIVLPFYQVYSDAGDFSVKNRAWTSIKENALLYGAVGALGALGIVILLFMQQITLDNMIGLGMGLSNTFGLVAGILLMGYGLVEIPRDLWKTSNPEVLLKWCAHRSGKYAEAVMKTTAELETVVTIIYANSRQMRRHDPLKPFMDIICDYAEKESPVKPSEMAQRNVDIDTLSAEDLEYNYDKKGLAELRRRMFHAIHEYKAARAQYSDVILESFELEDVVKCRQNRDYTPPPPRVVNGVGVGGQDAAALRAKAMKPWSRPLWTYKCVWRPYANKVYSVLLALTGACIVWGELVIPVMTKDLSPFSLIVRGMAGSQLLVQIMTLLPLAYICACSYFALFRITAFNYNKLVPGATTGAALMQNGSLMCRFAAPTCWNFYHIIRMSQDVCDSCAQTVFSKNMASMDVLLFQHFNLWLPCVLVFWVLLVLSTLLERMYNACVPAKFKFSSDDIDDEYTEKGRLLIRKEQEAMLKGYRIGEVLHSAYFDLEFPTIAAAGRGKKKGLFGMFGKKKVLEPIEKPPVPQPGAPKNYTSAAAQAAARWVRPSGAPGAALESLPMPETRTTGLLHSRYEPSVTDGPAPTTSMFGGPSGAGTSGGGGRAGGGGGGGGGLDGIFAEIGKMAGRSGGAQGGGGGGGASRLLLGSGTGSDSPASMTREHDSLLLGKFSRS